MNRFSLSILFIVGFVYTLGATVIFSEALAEETFIYDSMNKRDPFISLLDPSSSTGFRIDFTPPTQKVKLPLEITVRGILQKDEQRYAIINDDVVREGDNIGEVEIKRIEKDKVILRYGPREFTIYLRKEKEK